MQTAQLSILFIIWNIYNKKPKTFSKLYVVHFIIHLHNEKIIDIQGFYSNLLLIFPPNYIIIKKIRAHYLHLITQLKWEGKINFLK